MHLKILAATSSIVSTSLPPLIASYSRLNYGRYLFTTYIVARSLYRLYIIATLLRLAALSAGYLILYRRVYKTNREDVPYLLARNVNPSAYGIYYSSRN
jgi:hypothetical protein